jgi:hypothetical protein
LEENEMLKVKHRDFIREINEKVSDTMIKTEEATVNIVKFERENAISRKQLVKNLALFLEEKQKERDITAQALAMKKAAFDEKARDLEDLKEFEVWFVNVESWD